MRPHKDFIDFLRQISNEDYFNIFKINSGPWIRFRKFRKIDFSKKDYYQKKDFF